MRKLLAAAAILLGTATAAQAAPAQAAPVQAQGAVMSQCIPSAALPFIHTPVTWTFHWWACLSVQLGRQDSTSDPVIPVISVSGRMALYDAAFYGRFVITWDGGSRATRVQWLTGNEGIYWPVLAWYSTPTWQLQHVRVPGGSQVCGSLQRENPGGSFQALRTVCLPVPYERNV